VRPVSDSFLSTIRGSHRIAVTVRVLTTYQTGVNPTGTDLRVIRGDVTLDANADVRGTVSVTVDSDSDFTRNAGGLLTPYGHELHVARGVVYGSGTREMVSQGFYRIYAVEQSDRPGSPIVLEGRDRMSGIIDGRLEAPRQFTVGTSVLAIFTELVQEIYPLAAIDFDYDASTDVLSTNHVADESRYIFLRDLMKARGKIMYWDYRGRLQVRTAPNPTETVFDVNAGSHGVLVTLNRRLDREGVYNSVVARGEAPTDETEPVRAVARDMNPSSPTYFLGPFGQVPRFYQSPFITSVSGAQTAAEKILLKSIGLPYNIDFTMVPNPALEPLDPIKVSFNNTYENHVIQQLVIPLEVQDAMRGSTREQTDVIIDVE